MVAVRDEPKVAASVAIKTMMKIALLSSATIVVTTINPPDKKVNCIVQLFITMINHGIALSLQHQH